ETLPLIEGISRVIPRGSELFTSHSRPSYRLDVGESCRPPAIESSDWTATLEAKGRVSHQVAEGLASGRNVMSSRRSDGPMFVIVLLVTGNVALAVLSFSLWQDKERFEQQAAQATIERDQAKKSLGLAVAQLVAIRQRINHQTDVGFAETLEAID